MTQVKNWNKFQHFKDRRPPWIKLYRDLLDDPDWHEMNGDDAKYLVMIWLIASEDGGVLPHIKKLAFRLRLPEQKTKQLLSRLNHWLIQDDINPISDRYQDDAPETETETQEKRQIQPSAVADATDDPRTKLFRSGLTVLTRITGNGPASCRALIGKWLRMVSDDAALVLEAIEAAEAERIASPQGWILRRLQSTGPPARMSGFQPNNAKERTFNALQRLSPIADVSRGSASDGPQVAGVLPFRRSD